MDETPLAFPHLSHSNSPKNESRPREVRAEKGNDVFEKDTSVAQLCGGATRKAGLMKMYAGVVRIEQLGVNIYKSFQLH